MAAVTPQGSLAYTEQFGAGLRIAQVVGLTSTAFFAGRTFTQSFSATPALLLSPAPLLAKQWKRMFDKDKALAPAVALFGTSIFGYLGYLHHGRSRILFGASAALIALTVPYQFILGDPIYKKLEQLEAKAGSVSQTALSDASTEVGISKDETVHVLVDNWAIINLGQTVLAGLSALLATWAALNKIEAVPASVRLATGANRLGR